jgi:hypothetical protein
MVAAFRERRDLALENLALRQQLGVLKRKGVPRLKRNDRVFWVVLSQIWPHWRKVLHLIKADTVVGWQRKGFRIYWARISKRKSPGRHQVSSEVRALIKKMSEANLFWGAPRIHGELLKLGIEISERTVSRLMPKDRCRPGSALNGIDESDWPMFSTFSKTVDCGSTLFPPNDGSSCQLSGCLYLFFAGGKTAALRMFWQ